MQLDACNEILNIFNSGNMNLWSYDLFVVLYNLDLNFEML